MFKSLHKNEDVSLSIRVSSGFTGILRGFAHDESEGCTLSGELVMTTTHRIKIKKLETVFAGVCRVNLKTTNKMGVPTSDGTENRSVYRKKITHLDDTANSNQDNSVEKSTIEPGEYEFPFSFNIPPTLPHSFKAKYGSIEYELSAFVTRSMFNADAHTSRPVTLRRCLMNTLNPIPQTFQTVLGKRHPEIVKYSATAPSMVYCEGGLLELGLNVELTDPNRYSVRMVTCGLKERVIYRTTGRSSLTNQAMHHNESSFPLGCSTFFPSQHPEYNPADLHNYNAIFRLCPRMHTDNNSILIIVQHLLMIRIIIDDNEVKNNILRERSTDSVTSIASATSSIRVKSILSHLSIQQHERSSPVRVAPNAIDATRTPSLSRSPSTSELSVETTSGDSTLSTSPPFSSSELESIQRLQSNIVRVSSRKMDQFSSRDNDIFPVVEEAENDDDEERPFQDINWGGGSQHHLGHSLAMHHHFNPFQFHKGVSEEGSYECTLHIPIIVTSREEYREGGVPALPDYETAVDEPPSYRAALQNLPPVPIYPSNDELRNDSNNGMSNSL